ncbi:ABC-type transport system involved in multi-copper enzyme maturation%2C permease component [uncultured Ruminococcus sp.]|uniref:ABC transporter permease n=1 Tax=Massiliimalia timonensis TaxID=1987501 RepID=UPI000822C97B|nr:ABC transporter permease [Massiliimalia timonensis]MBS7175222.1 ABC transporter permease [Clostridiales bacterium]SCG99863.1 ABC-type transport system involved in multi-copper enzyme maturation%2C permease component [uncultured Clostridium sp.]SCH95659.1 ABC-type transport system involved in multi-copper enzyme maturation%2C permease component [uncultured Ruminococcus sp.]
MSAILRREFATYFRAPLGYIYLAIFYFFGGQFFSSVLYSMTNDISIIFSSMFSIMLFTIPLLTMRLMSEDKRLKTDQALLTAPVSLNGIVWGKFLAAFALFGIGIAITVIYFLILSAMASPQWNIFFGNLLGIILLGAALISIGMFISSLTESQMIAAIGGFAAMFFIFLIDSIASLIPISWLGDAIKQLSFTTRYNDFTSGILDFTHILFFLSVVVIFNFLTVRILERKRWS